MIAGIDMNQSPVGAPLVGAQLYSNGAVGYPQGIPLQYQQFIGDCIRQEKILPIHMGKVLRYNLEDIGFEGEIGELRAKY